MATTTATAPTAYGSRRTGPAGSSRWSSTCSRDTTTCTPRRRKRPRSCWPRSAHDGGGGRRRRSRGGRRAVHRVGRRGGSGAKQGGRCADRRVHGSSFVHEAAPGQSPLGTDGDLLHRRAGRSPRARAVELPVGGGGAAAPPQGG